jgi:RimJ/RimL family protein N-acetyltransferase
VNVLGRKVVLRAIEESDLADLRRWSNDPAIAAQLGGFHFPTSSLQMAQWLTRIQQDERNYRFAIETPDVGLIGTANLVDINWKDGTAFHGMLLGDKDVRGKGYGVDTIMAVMRYAFEELGLFRLDGSMIEYNEPSLGVYVKKCGWVVEGRQRGWYHRQGRRWDKIIVGVTRDDYAALVAANGYWQT